MKFRNLTALCGVLFLAVLPGIAQTTWTFRLASSQIPAPMGITWTGSKTVMVGEQGCIVYSNDHNLWGTTGMNSTTIWNSVAWTGTRLIAVSNGGGIYVSTDASVWTSSGKSGTTQPLLSVIWAGGQAIAAGADGTLLTSPDGLTWTSRNTAILGKTDRLNAVAWTGSRYVAVGSDSAGSDDYGIILTSPDAINWTQTLITAKGLFTVAWSGTQLVAAGAGGILMTSPDGLNWTTQSSGIQSTIWTLAWTGSRWAFGSDSGKISTSTDGVNWTPRYSGSLLRVRAMTWAGDRLMAALSKANSPKVSPAAYSAVLQSIDGVTWTSTSLTTNNLRGAAWTGDRMVTTGDGGLLFSSADGVNWVARPDFSSNVGPVSWAANRLYVTATNAVNDLLTTVYIAPNDSAIWIAKNTYYVLKAYAWNGSILVGVGKGIQSSVGPDSAWVPRVSDYESYNDVVWTGTQFVAVGPDTTQTSPDGITWTKAKAAVAFNSVAWNGTVLVAVGNNGRVFSSPDAVTWTQRTLTGGSSYSMYSVAAVDNKFVAVGQAGVVFSSPDGAIWTRQTSGAGQDLYKVVPMPGPLTGQYQVLAFGVGGTVVGSLIDGYVAPPPVDLPARVLLKQPLPGSTVPYSPQLSWQSVTGVSSYQLQIAMDSLFNSVVNNDTTLTGTEKTVSGLNPTGKYYWRVRAKSGAGYGSYSAVWSFFMSATPSLYFPARNAVNVKSPVILTWIGSGPTYAVQVARDSGFTTLVDINDTGLTDVHRTATFPDHMTYYWRVRSNNGYGVSPWSDTWTFSTTGSVSALPQAQTVNAVELATGRHLRFTLPSAERVSVSLVDFGGRHLAKVLDESRTAGSHDLTLPQVGVGAYLVDFRAGRFHEVLKVFPVAE